MGGAWRLCWIVSWSVTILDSHLNPGAIKTKKLWIVSGLQAVSKRPFLQEQQDQQRQLAPGKDVQKKRHCFVPGKE